MSCVRMSHRRAQVSETNICIYNKTKKQEFVHLYISNCVSSRGSIRNTYVYLHIYHNKDKRSSCTCTFQIEFRRAKASRRYIRMYIHTTTKPKNRSSCTCTLQIAFRHAKVKDKYTYLCAYNQKKKGICAPVYFKLHLIVRKYQGQIYICKYILPKPKNRSSCTCTFQIASRRAKVSRTNIHIYVHTTKTKKNKSSCTSTFQTAFRRAKVSRTNIYIYIHTTKKKIGVRAPVYFKLHLVVRKYKGQICIFMCI